MNRKVFLSALPLWIALCMSGLTACSGSGSTSRDTWKAVHNSEAYQDNDSAYTQPHGYMCSSGGIMSTGCE